jgi:Ca2+-binding RTX toxin-like protein
MITEMATLTVGTGQQYATIGAAVAASRDGDILQVQAGTYTNDFATINTKITLQGVGGMVKMVANGWIANDKGILITNTDVTIDHFEFSGAAGSSGNVAGIRYQGGNLVVTNSYFHDNQNGILGNAVANGTVTIDNSEFDHNGAGDGRTHNLYITEIARLTITDSYFHDAVVGNQIKSRAAETIISNTRVYDNDSSASWSIDLPYGGKAVLTNNIIEQGPNSQNSNIISFGVEGKLHPGSSLTMTNNLVVNDKAYANLLVNVGGAPVTMTGTQVWSSGQGTLWNGTNVTESGTKILTARPNLDASHPFDSSSSFVAPPPYGSNLLGGSGNDLLNGGAGQDTINGGAGQDTIRGNDGRDVIQGGAGNDDINGNRGNDTLYGGAGNDTVAGGQDQDLLFGDNGNDFLEGNDGSDTILGGQNDDVIFGGAGDDWLSGGQGSDTLTGGAGADIFHTWGGAGVDRVLDFNYAQGDRVWVDLGTTGSVKQVGADYVISMDGGGVMTLVGVNESSLGPNWLFWA